MYDGIWGVVLLITTITAFAGLFGKNAGMSVLFFIGLGIWFIRALVQEHRDKHTEQERQIMAMWRRQYPGWTDDEIYALRRKQQKEMMYKVNHRK